MNLEKTKSHFQKFKNNVGENKFQNLSLHIVRLLEEIVFLMVLYIMEKQKIIKEKEILSLI
jgi:hypothetical protein